MGANHSGEASERDEIAAAPHPTNVIPDGKLTELRVETLLPEIPVETPEQKQTRSSGGPAAALEFIPFSGFLFGNKEDPAGTKVAKEYTHVAKEQVKQVSILRSELLQSNTETINAKAAQAYAEMAMEQVLSMRSEMKVLRQELAENRKLAAEKPALATTTSTDVDLQPPVISQTFSSTPLVPTQEEIKARRKAELEASEEFAFAGRAIGLPSRLRTAGYSCTEAKQVAGYTFADARAAGYSLAEAAEADFAEAREALASISRRGSIQEYTPFELANGQEHNDDESEDGEVDVVPTPNELVARWQNEIPALRARSLSKQQTQSLSMLAEMLTGDVDSKHSEGKELGETSPIDVQRDWLTNRENEIVSTPVKSTPVKSNDKLLAESPS